MLLSMIENTDRCEIEWTSAIGTHCLSVLSDRWIDNIMIASVPYGGLRV